MKSPSLVEWLERWLDTYAPLRCRSLKTLERYRELANYVVHGATEELTALGRTRLTELHHAAIETAIVSLLRAPGERHEHRSARTVRHFGGLLHVALGKAWRLDLISENPMKKVELPRSEPRVVRALTAMEISRLRDSCRGDWMFPFVELALATGCRRGELLALEWTDIDWIHRTICIARSLCQTKSGLTIKSPKGGWPRIFVLPSIAITALRAQQRSSHGCLIFADDNGDYLKPDLVSQSVVRRIRKAGILDASLHSLRHSHATNLLSRGVPLSAIAMRLGHADPNITARIYCHALPLDDQRAADEWDRVCCGSGQDGFSGRAGVCSLSKETPAR
jgi:integrase